MCLLMPEIYAVFSSSTIHAEHLHFSDFYHSCCSIKRSVSFRMSKDPVLAVR